MTNYSLIPAHDPRVMVTIDVPVEGRKTPIQFIARRWEFQPGNLVEEYQDYLKSAVDPETGAIAEGRSADEMLIDWWIEHLPTIPDKDREALLALTAGERDQLWTIWREASKVDLGESEAS